MVLEYETTRDQALEAKRAFCQRSRVVRCFKRFGKFAFSLISILIFFLISFYQNLPFGNNPAPGGTLSLLFAVAISMPFFILYGIALGLAMHYMFSKIGRKITLEPIERLPDKIFGKRKVILDTEGISIQNPLYSASYTWESIDEYEEIPGFVLLKVFGTTVGNIPDRAFANPNEKSEFLRILAQNTEKKTS